MKHSLLRTGLGTVAAMMVVITLALSLPYYFFSRDLLREHTLSSMRLQAGHDLTEVELALETALQEAAHLVQSVEFRRSLRPGLADSARLQPLLAHTLAQVPHLQHLDIISAGTTDLHVLHAVAGEHGVVVSLDPYRLGQDHHSTITAKVRALESGFYVSPPTMAETGMVIYIGAAVEPRNPSSAVVLLAMDLTGFWAGTGIDVTQYREYLRFNDSVLITGSDLAGNAVMVADDLASAPFLGAAGSTGYSKVRSEGVDYTVYREVGEINPGHIEIAMSLAVPVQAITARVDMHQRSILIGAVLLLVAALVLLSLFGRRLARPLQQLMAAIEAFRRGQPIEQLPVERRDELGAMGRAIDSMVKEVAARSAAEIETGAKLRALFTVVKEGIVITDERGIIESVNPSLCAMFGYSEAELLGQNNKILMPETYASRHDGYMHNALHSGSIGLMGMYRDLQGVRKDGRRIQVEISVDVLHLPARRMFAATIRDITALRQHEQELVEAKLKAEIANAAKTNFLSMMSHEIRTPLNGVMGILQILEGEVTDAHQREYLSVASKSASNLLAIVNDILDMSKAESGKMELEATPFDLHELLEESVELYRARVLDQQLQFRFYMPWELPKVVVGDALRLQQMINNLLSNAIKFTEHGVVGMVAAWVPQGDQSGLLRLAITDTGIGIPRDVLPTIFEPFVQADTSISRAFGGTGLGLSIVHRIAALMGGGVSVDSELGKGSRFDLEIPLGLIEAAVVPSPLHWLQDRAVLMVGESTQNLLYDYLSHHGGRVTVCPVAEFDRGWVDTLADYDLVALECTTAMEAARLEEALQQRPASMPFICVCEPNINDETGAMAGVYYLQPPVLRRNLDGLFQQIQGELTGQTPTATSAAAGQEGAMARILLVEDNPVNQMVARSMLAKMGYEVSVANNGQEALERVRREAVDLVLMDCHMPVMDGFEATRQIRAQLGGRVLPIVAMTADASTTDRDSCIAAGMDDHLPKPVKMADLQAMVEQWLERGRQG